MELLDRLPLALEVFVFGMILSIDSFSAAMAMGHRPFTSKDALRFAIFSGGAEGLVTLVSALAGTHIIGKFDNIDHWVAFILLIGVALHMAYEGIHDLLGSKKDSSPQQLEFHSFTRVIIVSFATSLDGIGVGVSLGIAQKPLLPFVTSITLWAFTATILGLYLGRSLSNKFGSIMNLVGALVLVFVAFQILQS